MNKTIRMVGLVLWCDVEHSKAVFWCEDHGDLAYYDASMDVDPCMLALTAGDMVEFDMSLDGNVRRAHAPALVSARVCDNIQERLLETASVDAPQNSAPGGNVVPFDRKRAAG